MMHAVVRGDARPHWHPCLAEPSPLHMHAFLCWTSALYSAPPRLSAVDSSPVALGSQCTPFLKSSTWQSGPAHGGPRRSAGVAPLVRADPGAMPALYRRR